MGKGCEDVVLLEEQWKESHFYFYVFKVDEQIGFDPEDFPANTSPYITQKKCQAKNGK